MMSDNFKRPINLHIVPDSIFINKFISDIESISNDEDHLFIAISRQDSISDKFTYLDDGKVIYAPLKSELFTTTVGQLRKFKRIFIHWLLPCLENFVRSIPKGPLVCWCFWGEFDPSFGPLSRYLRYEKQSREFARASDITWHLISGRVLIYPVIPSFIRSGVRFLTSLLRLTRRVISISRVDIFLHWNEIDLQVLRHVNIRLPMKRHEFIYNVIDVTPCETSPFVDQLWKDHKLEGKTVLLLGHSAFPSGNHLDALDLLNEKIKNSSIRIISLLSYGDAIYREVVIEKGRRLFGARFIPITTLLPTAEYYHLLSRISAAFLNHRYSEGAGNIFRILLEGKPLFLNPRSTIFQMLRADGVKIYNAPLEISDQRISEFSNLTAIYNKQYILKRFSSGVSVENLNSFLSASR